MGATRGTVVDLWFDPVCPYSWTASRWLRDVGRRRQLTGSYRVMSLYPLKADRADVAPDYRRSVEASRGPAKVATGVAVRFGHEVLTPFYTAFGEQVLDVWRRPSAAEHHEVIRAGLAEVGLPADLEDALDSDDYDAPMRVSHDAGVAPAGSEAGTPLTAIDGVALLRPGPERDPARRRRSPGVRGRTVARRIPRSSSSSAPGLRPRSSREGAGHGDHDSQ